MNYMTDLIRLQKLIAASGFCSRREAEKYILAGKVKVNGVIVNELGSKFPSNVQITIDNKVIKDRKSVV